MDFNDSKAIYKQIVEYSYAHIANGDWREEERIPSTKDLAVQLGVNPRTVMKAYDELAADGIIFQRRGIGYFITTNAKELIMQRRRHEFETVTLPDFASRMKELGYTPESILTLINNLQTT